MKKQKTNNKAAFILKASKCIYNKLWICMHNDKAGEPCKKIYENYKDNCNNSKLFSYNCIVL